MKHKSLLTASILTLTFLTSVRASAQWAGLGVPSDGGVTDAISVSGTNIFSGTAYGGFFHSSDNGTIWSPWDGSCKGLPTTSVLAITTIGTKLFAGIGDGSDTGGGVFLSTDSGASWTAAGLSNAYVYAMVAIDSNLFAATHDVSRSTNNGARWTVLPMDAFSLAVIGSRLFAGTGHGVSLSMDYGTSWSAVNNGLPDSNIFALASNGSNLFATTGPNVFTSSDFGTSWTLASNGLAGASYVYTLAAIGDNLFAGTENGVILSTNNGASWTSVSDGLPASAAPGSHIDVYSLAANDTYLFAGVYQAQVYRRPLSEMVPNSAVKEEPPAFAGFQIYPNPTSGLLHIQSNSNDIIITDLLGRIWPNSKDGTHNLDVSGLPQGVYSISDDTSRAQFVKE